MKKVCCYCKVVYGHITPAIGNLPKDAVTHGICPKCMPIAEKELARVIERLQKEKS